MARKKVEPRRICCKCGVIHQDSVMHKKGKRYYCPICFRQPRTEARLRAARRRWGWMEAQKAMEVE